jgi:urease accessory protein
MRTRFLWIALACVPVCAAAHTGNDGAAHHGFLAGLLHPLTGLDHLAAMLAVGLWSALTLRRRLWLAPLTFVALLLAGALHRPALGLLTVEPMIAVSLLALGLFVAVRVQVAAPVGALAVGTFALFHGAAHSEELGGSAALAGMLLATILLHTLGIALGLALRERSPWWTRAAGGAVALLGAVLLAQ